MLSAAFETIRTCTCDDVKQLYYMIFLNCLFIFSRWVSLADTYINQSDDNLFIVWACGYTHNKHTHIHWCQRKKFRSKFSPWDRFYCNQLCNKRLRTHNENYNLISYLVNCNLFARCTICVQQSGRKLYRMLPLYLDLLLSSCDKEIYTDVLMMHCQEIYKHWYISLYNLNNINPTTRMDDLEFSLHFQDHSEIVNITVTTQRKLLFQPSLTSSNNLNFKVKYIYIVYMILSAILIALVSAQLFS